MFGSAHLVAFVPTTNLGRATAFYEGTLGLTLQSSNPFASVFRSGTTMLRVTTVDTLEPQPFTVLGWSVVDIAGAASQLAAAGVAAERYAGVEQDEQGVWTSPDGSRILWFRDPDGNTLSLTQFA